MQRYFWMAYKAQQHAFVLVFCLFSLSFILIPDLFFVNLYFLADKVHHSLPYLLSCVIDEGRGIEFMPFSKALGNVGINRKEMVTEI